MANKSKADKIRIAGVDYPRSFFDRYMSTIFSESFAHSSLSFEKVFTEAKELERKMLEFASQKNSTYALELDAGPKKNHDLLIQRFNEVRDALVFFGIQKDKSIDEYGNEIKGAEQYASFYAGAIRPYRNKRELEIARENGELTGAPYEEETVLDRCRLLAELILKKMIAERTAFDLKQGNNKAFAYAIDAVPFSITKIIRINELVNNQSGIHVGFKSSDNDIIGAPFRPCPKELVPVRMQELLYKYDHEWKDEIPEFDELTGTEAEKEAHLKAVCEREAKFHIEFERIHPFEDGNGRTGRIILNSNLIANQLAPILITPQLHDVYIECIDTNNYQRLANYIYILSSVSLTEMVSHYRLSRGIDPDKIGIQKNMKQPDNNIKITKKRKK